MKMSKVTLESGLRVITVPMVGVESVTVMAAVGVGSRYEAKNKNGLSHFLEHMVFKGTKKWPSAMKVARVMDGAGASHNAFTSKEYTGYYMKAASDQLDLCLDVVSDLVYAPKLPASELEREKGVIIEEIRMYNDLPQRKVGDEFDALLYGEVGLGRRVDGTEEVVKGFGRKDFVKHWREYYGLENVVVVVAGAIDEPEGKIEEYFVGKAGRASKVKGKKKLGVVARKGVGLRVIYKDIDQAHMVLGYPGIAIADKDRYAATMLSIILGGNMSSRLFNEVREKRGLAYYTRCDLDRYLDAGTIAASQGVDVKRVDEAIKVTLGVFGDVVGGGKRGLSGKELRAAKDYFAGHMKLGFEGSMSVARYWAMKAVLGDEMIGPDEVVKRVRAVSLADVKRVAKRLLVSEKLQLAVVGPFKDEGKFGKLLVS